MTQPPLSHAISKLEAELGVQLLERTPRGIRPTAAGIYLIENGSKLLASKNRIEETLHLMGQGMEGELRVGVEPMVANEIIAEALAEFVEQAPNARVTLMDAAPGDMVRMIQRGEIDLGCVPFSPTNFAGVLSEFLDWQRLTSIELKLAVPQDRANEHHPEARGWGRWIVPHRIPAFRGMVDRVEQELHDDPTFRMLTVSTPQTAVPFVAAGLGVAPVTQSIAEFRPGVALVDPPAWLGPMGATMIWRRDVEITPIMSRWLEIARMVGRWHSE